MTEAGPASSRYWLNRVLFDLGESDNRALFAADKAGYFRRYPLDAPALEALQGPDWQSLLRQGTLPNLLYRYYMLCGFPPDRFAETFKAGAHG